jgi:hypothetical protein
MKNYNEQKFILLEELVKDLADIIYEHSSKQMQEQIQIAFDEYWDKLEMLE